MPRRYAILLNGAKLPTHKNIIIIVILLCDNITRNMRCGVYSVYGIHTERLSIGRPAVFRRSFSSCVGSAVPIALCSSRYNNNNNNIVLDGQKPPTQPIFAYGVGTG